MGMKQLARRWEAGSRKDLACSESYPILNALRTVAQPPFTSCVHRALRIPCNTSLSHATGGSISRIRSAARSWAEAAQSISSDSRTRRRRPVQSGEEAAEVGLSRCRTSGANLTTIDGRRARAAGLTEPLLPPPVLWLNPRN